MKIKEGFKLAYYRRIPAYYNPSTDELMGRNWFYDQLIELNVWFDIYVFNLEELPILVKTDDEEQG